MPGEGPWNSTQSALQAGLDDLLEGIALRLRTEALNDVADPLRFYALDVDSLR